MTEGARDEYLEMVQRQREDWAAAQQRQKRIDASRRRNSLLAITGAITAVGLIAIIGATSGPSVSELAYLAAADSTGSEDEALAEGREICLAPMQFDRSDARIAVQNLCPDRLPKFDADWAEIDRATAERAAAQQRSEAAAEAKLEALQAAAKKAVADGICQAVAEMSIESEAADLRELRLGTPGLESVPEAQIRSTVAESCPQNQPVVDQYDAAKVRIKAENEAELARSEAEQAEFAQKVAAGTAVSGGSHVVGSGDGQMRPGTWATTSTDILENCYWERTSGTTGEIIDNYISTAASKVTVTVRSGETFTSSRCGAWEKTS